MKKPLLILDLDETLIYTTPKNEFKNEEYDFVITDEFYVKKRPHVEEFLIEMANHFELAVWTAASRGYGKYIVEELFTKNNLELQFFHSREHCINKEYIRVMDDYYPQQYYIKDLSKIKKKFSLDKVLMVDDLNLSLQRNYGNLVRVDAFKGDKEDNHLLALKEYLISIKDVENLRKIEKRYWKKELEKKFNNDADNTPKKLKI